jgi:hypothetical protein
MPAFVREGGVEYQARLCMNAWLGCWGLEYGQEQVFRLRMSHCTGDFALLAADAALWMDKDSFHIQPTSFVIGLDEAMGNPIVI